MYRTATVQRPRLIILLFFSSVEICLNVSDITNQKVGNKIGDRLEQPDNVITAWNRLQTKNLQKSGGVWYREEEEEEEEEERIHSSLLNGSNTPLMISL